VYCKEMQFGAVDWISLQGQVIVTETCSCSFKIIIVLLDSLFKDLLLNVPQHSGINYVKLVVGKVLKA